MILIDGNGKSQTPFPVSQTIIIHQYQEFNECIWFIKTTQVHQLQKIKEDPTFLKAYSGCKTLQIIQEFKRKL